MKIPLITETTTTKTNKDPESVGIGETFAVGDGGETAVVEVSVRVRVVTGVIVDDLDKEEREKLLKKLRELDDKK